MVLKTRKSPSRMLDCWYSCPQHSSRGKAVIHHPLSNVDQNARWWLIHRGNLRICPDAGGGRRRILLAAQWSPFKHSCRARYRCVGRLQYTNRCRCLLVAFLYRCFGAGKMNENGKHPLELCSLLDLSVASTFFEGSMRSKVTWMCTCSWRWHQLDQCFSTGRMVHPRMNEIFARVNEKTGVNEGWVNFLLLSFCILWFLFFSPNTYQQSLINW